MKFATWNTNSVRARFEALQEFLQQHQPDVLGLQETKVQDHDFPVEAITELGYQVVYVGQKSYNGVAIISRLPAKNVLTHLSGAEDCGARFIAGDYVNARGETVRFINVYVVNGKEVGCEAYQVKLHFLASLDELIQKESQSYARLVVVGDFNIAPSDEDVYDPEEWRDKILCSAPERQAFTHLIEGAKLRDILPLYAQAEAGFTWWDYRGFGYRRKRGLRIDHILASEAMAKTASSCWVDRETREKPKPSDHAPVLAEFAD